MTIWIDANLPPQVAVWLRLDFSAEAYAVCDLGLRDSEDDEIFAAAREAGATVMTKDRDFVDLVQRHGPPPQVIWLTLGNTSNTRLRSVLSLHFPAILELLARGETLVEIGD